MALFLDMLPDICSATSCCGQEGWSPRSATGGRRCSCTRPLRDWRSPWRPWARWAGTSRPSRQVFEKGEQLPYGGVDHGEFRLRNIALPVDVVEVLWTEGQLARAPLEEIPEI
jgi:hypothetical protein